jgi:3-hydroxyacyl-CoA dehydrogenase / enoyl-CoA hydratase / 3-hydroxybutyryl-CoA epimerase
LKQYKTIYSNLENGLGERFSGPQFSRILIEHGRKGRASKAGFYDYDDGQPVYYSRIRTMLNIEQVKENVEEDQLIQDRFIFSMLNEAVRCLDEGIAGVPGSDAARQIDLGSITGVGFPPFRGGLLYYAGNYGLRNILNRMKTLEQEYGPRFSPAEGLKKRTLQGSKFY